MLGGKFFKIQGLEPPTIRHLRCGGFTVVEVLIAMTIFSIAILGLAAGTASVMRANQTSYHNSIAANLAQDKLEELKSRTAANITPGNDTQPIDNVTFTRDWTVTTDAPVPGVTRIDVTMTWNDYTNHSLTVSSAVKQ